MSQPLDAVVVGEKPLEQPPSGLEWGPSMSSSSAGTSGAQFETVSLMAQMDPVHGAPGTPPAPAPAPVGNNQDEEVPTGMCACLSIKYYRPLFNVDTTDVVKRFGYSLAPFRSVSFFEEIDSSPDMYGPFWIAATLVFVVGAAANLNSWVRTPSDKISTWTYDFSLMTQAASVVFGYVCLVPVLAWAVLKYFKVPLKYSKLLCLHGYALGVFVPVAVVCISPSNILDWLAVTFASATSTALLLVNVYPVLAEHTPASAVLLCALMAGCQIGFALLMKLYFFGLMS